MNQNFSLFNMIGIVGALAIGIMLFAPNFKNIDLPEVVRIPAGQYSYRPAGVYYIGTRVVDAPLEIRTVQSEFEIMKYHVSQQEYARCVSDDACVDVSTHGDANLPQVNVSYFDATDYALWLSEKTDQIWRLPLDEEWVRAAGNRYSDVLIGTDSDYTDPAKLWLEKYRSDAIQRSGSDAVLKTIGSFGENDLGLSDINGNIWEWTQTCFRNGKVSDDGQSVISTSNYCGVRAAQGKHRAFIIEFVRDAKGGGCAVGIPPDNLGFRLVRANKPL